MKNQKKYQISVCGETVRLLSDEKEEYINSLADYVEQSMKNLSKNGLSPDMSVSAQFLFTAILMADKLFKSQAELMDFADKLSKSQMDLQGAKDKLSKSQKELQDVKEKLAESQLELASVKKEFEQFVTEFDHKG